MSSKKEKRDPLERVEHMNSIFDRLVLPIIIFTLAVFLIFGIIPKIGSCRSADTGEEQTAGSLPAEEQTKPLSAYDKRDELLSDFAAGSALYEKAGFVLADNEGETVAYSMLDSGLEIFENMRDSNDYAVTILSLEEGEKKTVITVYSESIFLVSVTDGSASAAAIFDSDSFTAAESSSDPDRDEVLKMTGSDALADLVTQYLDTIGSIYDNAE